MKSLFAFQLGTLGNLSGFENQCEALLLCQRDYSAFCPAPF
jgi:hypothetical protein